MTVRFPLTGSRTLLDNFRAPCGSSLTASSPPAAAKQKAIRMNSINTHTVNEDASSSRELQRKLKQMEKDGASLIDRTQAAIDFIEAQKKKSSFKPRPSAPDTEDEELAFEDDPHTSAQDPHTSAQDPHTSAQQAHASAQDAPTSALELPPPPKFQFGPGNPLYEIALD